jgi:hypothetical protein
VHTDAEGFALLPRLMPYQVNTIRLDANDLPINAELDNIEMPAVPAARSAVKIVFPVRSGRGALLRIVFDDGEPAPAGAEVELVGDKEGFFVARRGESFVTGMKDSNQVRLKWKGASCTFDRQTASRGRGRDRPRRPPHLPRSQAMRLPTWAMLLRLALSCLLLAGGSVHAAYSCSLVITDTGVIYRQGANNRVDATGTLTIHLQPRRGDRRQHADLPHRRRQRRQLRQPRPPRAPGATANYLDYSLTRGAAVGGAATCADTSNWGQIIVTTNVMTGTLNFGTAATGVGELGLLPAGARRPGQPHRGHLRGRRKRHCAISRDAVRRACPRHAVELQHRRAQRLRAEQLPDRHVLHLQLVPGGGPGPDADRQGRLQQQPVLDGGRHAGDGHAAGPELHPDARPGLGHGQRHGAEHRDHRQPWPPASRGNATRPPAPAAMRTR